MHMNTYKPTAKGIKRGLAPTARIMFINEHYVHIAPTISGYRFQQGDAFEWKPGYKRPDSLWQVEAEIDPTSILDQDLISQYNRTENAVELAQMGIK
jgi:hypothetical protein